MRIATGALAALLLFATAAIAQIGGPMMGGGGGAKVGGVITGGTNNSVVFVNPAGTLAQDNPNFTYTLGTTTLAVPTISSAAGLVGTPSHYFGGDTTTGFYRPLANQIAIAVSGAQTHTFTSSSYTNSSNSAQIAMGASGDAIMAYATTNSVRFGSTAANSINSRTEMNKAVAAIADNVATAVLTVTVPNAAHSASLMVRLTCSAGAGGAIGANEATAVNEYVVSLTRTAGVAAVATISTAYGAAASTVAGANAITAVAAMSAVSGAVGATNTFTVNATVARAAGTATNHTCLVYGQLMNANTSGITIS